MSSKPEILFLAHRIPYPPNKGDKIRSWRLFRHLATRFSMHLACFVDDPADYVHTDYLRSICASATFIRLRPLFARLKSARGFLTNDALSMRYYRNSDMARMVDSIRARSLTAEVAFSSTMAQYIERPRTGRLRIVDFCDADSEKWRQYADSTAFPMSMVYTRESKMLCKTENEIANWADISFAVTSDEAALFNRRSEVQQTVHWWSNGVDAHYFDPDIQTDNAVKGADIVFTGMMNYPANVDAVLHFATKIWPIVRAEFPRLTFAIVGANPTKAVQALDGKQGVTVTGRVADVRPWIKQAKIVTAPLRIARGLQNKILEGMAMGKPVVVSREAAAGLFFDGDHPLVIADDAQAMAVAICRLIDAPAECAQLGARARNAIKAHYSWDAQLSRFDDYMQSAIEAQSSIDENSSSNVSSW